MSPQKTKRGLIWDYWALPRPMTKGWGSGKVWQRICEIFGQPDIAFGKTDGIPNNIKAVDKNLDYEWANLPFADNQFLFGYWDPPYDKLYRPEGMEIWRCCKKLAILHTHVYPTSWFIRGKRIGMVAITMGPLKVIRILQIFEKNLAQEVLL